MDDSKYVFHASIEKNKDGLYDVYFPVLKSGGCGFRDFESTINFAGELLSEILLDFDSEKAEELQKEDKRSLSGQNNLYATKADIKLYSTHIKQDLKKDYSSNYSAMQENEEKTAEPPMHGVNMVSYGKSNTSVAKGSKSKKTRFLIIAAAIVCLIACISIINGINERNWEKEIEETIQGSRDHISSHEYEQGYRSLDSLRDNPETGHYAIEIESLYDYALLKDCRENNGGLTIEEQYEYSQNMMFETDDELYKDAANLSVEIKNEYEEEKKRIAEEEAKQAVKEEAKEAKERKEYLEKLSTTIPFEGMESKYIDCTMCGAHNYEENELSGMHIDYDLLCYWQTETENWFRVYIKDDEVVEVEELRQQHNYWDDDGFPIVEDLKKVKKEIIDEYGSDRDAGVDSYWTGKEYADKCADKFIKALKEKKEYSSSSEEDLKTIGWINAYDYWLKNQKVKFYDVQDYYDSISDSEN